MIKLMITPAQQRIHLYKFLLNKKDIWNKEIHILPKAFFNQNQE